MGKESEALFIFPKKYLMPKGPSNRKLIFLLRAEFVNAAASIGKTVVFLEAIDDIQEIILCTKKVITDYSSIAYDYVKMQKVVQYYCSDQALYAEIHGLYHETVAEMLQ